MKGAKKDSVERFKVWARGSGRLLSGWERLATDQKGKKGLRNWKSWRGQRAGPEHMRETQRLWSRQQLWEMRIKLFPCWQPHCHRTRKNVTGERDVVANTLVSIISILVRCSDALSLTITGKIACELFPNLLACCDHSLLIFIKIWYVYSPFLSCWNAHLVQALYLTLPSLAK